MKHNTESKFHKHKLESILSISNEIELISSKINQLEYSLAQKKIELNGSINLTIEKWRESIAQLSMTDDEKF